MDGDRSDYTAFSDLGQHGSRYSWPQTRCAWLRERLATRDFGYCLVLAVTTVALLALISANGDKATRLTDLEGRFLELTNSSTNLTNLEGRIKALESRNQTQMVNTTSSSKEDLETRISNNTRQIATLRSTVEKNTQALEKLQGSGQKNETTAGTGAKVVDERKNDTEGKGDSKNVTTKAPEAGRR